MHLCQNTAHSSYTLQKKRTYHDDSIVEIWDFFFFLANRMPKDIRKCVVNSI